jgi:hypothetical protein
MSAIHALPTHPCRLIQEILQIVGRLNRLFMNIAGFQ